MMTKLFCCTTQVHMGNIGYIKVVRRSLNEHRLNAARMTHETNNKKGLQLSAKKYMLNRFCLQHTQKKYIIKNPAATIQCENDEWSLATNRDVIHIRDTAETRPPGGILFKKDTSSPATGGTHRHGWGGRNRRITLRQNQPPFSTTPSMLVCIRDQHWVRCFLLRFLMKWVRCVE